MPSLKTFVRRYGWVAFLVVVALWFTFDLASRRIYLNDPEFVHYYPVFRQWFLEQILGGTFPMWNPYWGIGTTTDIEATIPIDIYSLPQAIFGAKFYLFQPMQIVLLLLAGYFGFQRLKLGKGESALASLAFLFSPWVLHQTFFFTLPNILIGLLLAAPLATQWMENGGRGTWLKLFFAVVFTLFGTRPDFWLFFLTYLALLGAVAAVVHRKPGRLPGLALAVLLGVLAHGWQINPLLQILSESGRVRPVGLSALFHSEIYAKLWLSLRQNVFLMLGGFSLALALTLRKENSLRWLGCVGLVLLALPAQIYNLVSLHGFGAALAMLLWFVVEKPSRSKALLTAAFYLPLSYYWCRLGDGDVGEVAVMRLAPVGLQISFGFLTFYAAVAAERYRPMKIFYTLILILFVVRDQGQILLSYVAGLPWIPTRENFLIDFSLAALAGRGLMELGQKWNSLPIVGCAVLIVSLLPNKFYSQWEAKPGPESFGMYTGLPGGDDALRAIRDSKTWRGYYTWPGGLEANALRLKANEVTVYSSLMNARYRDWTINQRFGILPSHEWSAYPGGYTKETIAKLPTPKTYGYPNDHIYWWKLRGFVPRSVSLFQLLGVNHILSPDPLTPIPPFSEHQKIGNFHVARVRGVLPRAFLVPRTVLEKKEAFENEMLPQVGISTIQAAGLDLPFRPAEITEYEPHTVAIRAQSRTGAVLVLSDLYHPFWEVFVDGKKQEIFPAMYIFRAVELPPGVHEVVFRCRIPYFGWGFFLSGLSLFVALSWGWRLPLPEALRSRLRRPRSFADPLGAYRSAGSSRA